MGVPAFHGTEKESGTKSVACRNATAVVGRAEGNRALAITAMPKLRGVGHEPRGMLAKPPSAAHPQRITAERPVGRFGSTAEFPRDRHPSSQISASHPDLPTNPPTRRDRVNRGSAAP